MLRNDSHDKLFFCLCHFLEHISRWPLKLKYLLIPHVRKLSIITQCSHNWHACCWAYQFSPCFEKFVSNKMDQIRNFATASASLAKGARMVFSLQFFSALLQAKKQPLWKASNQKKKIESRIDKCFRCQMCDYSKQRAIWELVSSATSTWCLFVLYRPSGVYLWTRAVEVLGKFHPKLIHRIYAQLTHEKIFFHIADTTARNFSSAAK